MNLSFLVEGPFESDYSLAIVNRQLAKALHQLGVVLRLHQRDNVTAYPPSEGFLRQHPALAPLFVGGPREWSADVHSRYIYPPHVDGFVGKLAAFHCYGWEETGFPVRYVEDFNSRLDLITVMSDFVGRVLRQNGVRIPIVPVGLGADHVLEQEPEEIPGISTDEFVFLHVSSCFPRKAPEVLVEAFCQEFSRRDHVRLVIKTFQNPHNRLERILREAFQAYPSHAPVDVIWATLRPGQIRWLYEKAGCLVSASRGEGFSLPVAEAMLVGCPVIATIYSGQADICTDDNCWPVDYRLAPARTHLTEGKSEWAEPSLPSLRRQMRELYRLGAEDRRRRTEAARRRIQERFLWRVVAERHLSACEQVRNERLERVTSLGTSRPRLRIGFVSTWNSRCGIAEYTRYLVRSLPPGCEPHVFAEDATAVRADEEYVVRCWTPDGGVAGRKPEQLAAEIARKAVDVVSIQFNFGFFAPSALEYLIDRLHRARILTGVTLHSTSTERLDSLRTVLRKADLCICHRSVDLEKMREPELARKTFLLRHGIPHGRHDREALRQSRSYKHCFVISCFGFFLLPKGIHHLLQAFALARNVNPLLRLHLLNALYPDPQSERYAGQCLTFIQNRGLAGCVSITTDFLDDEAVIRSLACSDLVVLPYCHSSESSSAAVRLPIASMTPILCSDLPIFDEFADCVHRFPAGDVYALANTILRLSADPEELNKHRARQQAAAEALSWPAVAQEFAALLLQRLAARSGVERGCPDAIIKAT